jgi:hypothetical protein
MVSTASAKGRELIGAPAAQHTVTQYKKVSGEMCVGVCARERQKGMRKSQDGRSSGNLEAWSNTVDALTGPRRRTGQACVSVGVRQFGKTAANQNAVVP